MSAVISGRPFRPIASLSRALEVLLMVGILGDLVNIIVTGLELGVLGRYLRGEVGPAEADAAINRSGAVGIVILVIFLATVVVWLVWQHRAQSNLHALRIDRLRFTPGWAVGWWLIPFANLWKPFQTMRELWKASGGDADWWRRTTWRLIGFWWAGYVTFNFLYGLTIQYFGSESATVQSFMVGDRLSIAGDVGSIATAIMAIVLVRSIAGRQEGLPDRVAVHGVPPRPDLPFGP